MINTDELLIKKYFEENSIVQSNLESFNRFIDVELQKIIEENRVIEPTIIPPNVDDFKIQLDKIWVTVPEIIEADGSKRNLTPIEARIRKLSYSAPIMMEVSAHINGVKRETFKTQIGNMPIMLKSKKCHLYGLSQEELIKKGEDPKDPGGYFIINGTEKVIVTIEDLAANTLMIEKVKTGMSPIVGKLFSESGSYKIPHTVEKIKDGLYYLSFTRIKRVPIVVLIKALGMTKDEDIMNEVGLPDNTAMYVNLFEFVDIKTTEDAIDFAAKKVGITQTKDIRLERMKDILTKYLLPHIGLDEKNNHAKAVNLCKILRKFIDTETGKRDFDDKDHYGNKRLKLSGELMADLLRVNIKVLIGDLLYNFQRIVKRGKVPSVKVIIREKLLTQGIYSSLATGNWVGGRKGVAQRMSRHNFIDALSHLQRVVSPLSTSQENFEARALHPTHLGRLCPSETPEGTNIGLRKNMAIMLNVTQNVLEEEIFQTLKKAGLEVKNE